MTSPDDRLLDKVVEIIVQVAEVPVDQVTPDKNLVSELDIDSLTMTETVVALQDHFNVELSDEDMREITTVRDIVDHLERIGVHA
jgi:acyl carrier protein